MIIIGIDPGLQGALAVLNLNMPSISYRVWDAPTAKTGKGTVLLPNEMRQIMVEAANEGQGAVDGGLAHIYIEQVHAMRKQGLTSTFSFGMGYGIWIGLASASRIPYTLVTPQAWKKEMMAGMNKEKAASVVRAQQAFPEAELVTPRGRKLDGRADALLLAEYGRRQYQGQLAR